MRIEITSGGKKWEWEPRDGVSSFTVGRRHGNDIVIEEDEGVSNLHLRIDHFLRSWTYTDQMSDTGTYHNGEYASTGDLKQGDVLKIGNSTLRVISMDRIDYSGGGGNIGRPFGRPAQAAAPPPEPAGTGYGSRQGQRGDYTSGQQGRRGGYDRGAGQYASQPKEDARAQKPAPQPQPQQAQRPHAAPPPPPNVQVNRGGQQRPQAKGSPAAGFAVFAVVLVIAGIIFFVSMMEDLEPDGGPIGGDNVIAEDPVTVDPLAELRLQVMMALDEQSELSDLERLKLVNTVLADDGIDDSSLSTEKRNLNRLKTRLEVNVRNEVNRRNSEASSNIRAHLRDDRTRQARVALAEWRALVNGEPEYKAAFERLRLDIGLDRLSEDITKRNVELLHTTLQQVDTLGWERKYSEAADALQGFVDNLSVNEEQAQGFQREVPRLRLLAEQQEKGEAPPVRAPFDLAANPVPPAPKEGLTPSGDLTAMRALQAFERRIQDQYRKGEIDSIAVELFGHPATLNKPESGNRWQFRVSRLTPAGEEGKPDRRIAYNAELTFFTVPPETRALIYINLPELSREDWLGILHYCFNNGLQTQALMAAAKFAEAHPDAKPQLDVYMAAKLRVTVPDGGFEVADGAYVIPEPKPEEPDQPGDETEEDE